MNKEAEEKREDTTTQEDLLPAAVPTAPDAALAILDKKKVEVLWKVAQKFARSGIVPAIFRDKPDDCFIALQMAARMRVDPMMLMQSAYIVHGKLGFEAKFAVGLINNSGLLEGRMKFRISNPDLDPSNTKYAVQAYGKDKETGQEVEGEWITWAMVTAEGWDGKAGSKWKTMPGQMFHYRAAMFFIRRHYPEVLLGMKTTDEIIDADFTVTPSDRGDELKKRLNEGGEEKKPAPPPATETTPPPAPDAPDPEKCPNCDGPLMGGETETCPHCNGPLKEIGQSVGERDEETLEKQNRLMALIDKIAGGDPLEMEKVLHGITGKVLVNMVHGKDLDTAIKAAEERLKEKMKGKGKGKGKKSGDLFDQ